jgi:hypothetical protein
MQHVFVKAEEFADHIKEYVNNRIAAVKLQAAERSSKVLSDVLALMFLAAILFVFVIFISMAAAYALSAWIGESYAGFLIVSGIWLVIALLVWMNKESILRIPIMNKMIAEMFRNEKDT